MNIEFTSEMVTELRRIYDAAIADGTLVAPQSLLGEEPENAMTFDEFMLETKILMPEMA